MKLLLLLTLFSLPILAETGIKMDANEASKSVKQYQKWIRDQIPEKLYDTVNEKINLAATSGFTKVTVDLDRDQLPYIPKLLKDLRKKGYKASSNKDEVTISWAYPK